MSQLSIVIPEILRHLVRATMSAAVAASSGRFDLSASSQSEASHGNPCENNLNTKNQSPGALRAEMSRNV